jgi:hypothetical protein
MVKSFPVPQSLCPTCGYPPDYTSSMIGTGKPVPGDFSLCYNCGECLQFDDGLRLKIATQHELDEHLSTKFKARLRQAQFLIRQRGPLPSKERKH